MLLNSLMNWTELWSIEHMLHSHLFEPLSEILDQLSKPSSKYQMRECLSLKTFIPLVEICKICVKERLTFSLSVLMLCAVTSQVTMVMLVHQWLISYFLQLHILRNVAPMWTLKAVPSRPEWLWLLRAWQGRTGGSSEPYLRWTTIKDNDVLLNNKK